MHNGPAMDRHINPVKVFFPLLLRPCKHRGTATACKSHSWIYLQESQIYLQGGNWRFGGQKGDIYYLGLAGCFCACKNFGRVSFFQFFIHMVFKWICSKRLTVRNTEIKSPLWNFFQKKLISRKEFFVEANNTHIKIKNKKCKNQTRICCNEASVLAPALSACPLPLRPISSFFSPGNGLERSSRGK